MNKFLKFIVSFGICYLTAFLGSFVTIGSIPTWYASLNKPRFNPPNWIFGPVWTVLFTLIGISLYLVWTNTNFSQKNFKKSLTLFVLQLVFNFLWSFLFFYLHQPLWALIDIFILWLMIFLTIKNFFKISKASGYLLIPYLVWVSFASILNFAIWWLNL